MSVAPLRYQVAAMTHRGAMRSGNEDAVSINGSLLVGDMNEPSSFVFDASRPLMVGVADGMGGHVHGALASRTALDALSNEASRLSDLTTVANALSDANERIYDVMGELPETAGMGSTIVGVTLSAGMLYHFNVGDSRLYRHRPGVFVQLSEDHALSVTGPGGRRRASHAITQSLGGRLVRTSIVPHLGKAAPLTASEQLLVCSDGLTDMLADEEIRAVLDSAADPGTTVGELFEHAMAAGGRDNISVVVICASSKQPS